MADYKFKHWAYLSYSPQDNCAQLPDTAAAGRRCWGLWLQEALTNFSLPPEFVGQINGRGEITPERIEPVFLAESESLENAALSAEVRQTLEQSRCLVVVCSPRSAHNPQVNEAVRYFKQLGRGKYIFPFVVAGEPNAGTGNKPGVSPADECFVPALRHPVHPDGTPDTARRAGKQIFVDARHGAEKREILTSDHRHAEADLEMAKIQLIALLAGVGFHGLWWREQKRHFFDLAEAQHQAREALNKIEETRRQLEAAQQQTRDAQNQALELQNLPRDVHGQIQEAQKQSAEAQQQVRDAQQQLQEFQNRLRDAQTQVEEARQRALAAESKVRETQQQAQEIQVQLEAARNQVHTGQDAQGQSEEIRQQAQVAHEKFLAAQSQIQELQDQTRTAQSQLAEAREQVRAARNAQGQSEEIRRQAQVAHEKFLAAQNQIQELQNQARTAQSQLTDAREQVRQTQGEVLEAQKQARAAQDQARDIQNRASDNQSQIEAAQVQVQKFQHQNRAARRLTKVFALLAVLALMSAGVVATQAWRQRQAASQALTKATAETSGKFDLASIGEEPIQQVLQKIGGAEQVENRRRSLNALAAALPRTEISEALTASAVIVADQERTHFQKWLLVRLAWANPLSALTNASAITGKIVNDEGREDSGVYFQLAVLDNWMRTDLPEAFRWVCLLPDSEAHQRALDKIIRWVQTQPDSEDKTKALTNCISELAKTDAPGALAVAESLPEGVSRDTLMAQLWMEADPFALTDWINSLGLPPEIMAPGKAVWPWTASFQNAYFGRPEFFPAATEVPSGTTNSAAQIQTQE